VIGTGAVVPFAGYEEVKLEAERRHVELLIASTSEAIPLVEKESAANAISSRDLLEVHALPFQSLPEPRRSLVTLCGDAGAKYLGKKRPLSTA
jgi:hypothetical protein